MLKVTENQGSTLSLEDTLLEIHRGEVKLTPPSPCPPPTPPLNPSLFRVNICSDLLIDKMCS